MERKRYSAGYLRKCIWRCLEISVSATIPDMVAGIEGIGFDSVKKALRQLEIHGYVVKSVGKRGGHQLYVKGRRAAVLPNVCGCCKAPFAAKTCDSSFTEKERKKEKERESATRGERGQSRVAEMVERVNQLGNYPRLPAGPAAITREVPAELKARLELALNPATEVPDDAA